MPWQKGSALLGLRSRLELLAGECRPLRPEGMWRVVEMWRGVDGLEGSGGSVVVDATWERRAMPGRQR